MIPFPSNLPLVRLLVAIFVVTLLSVTDQANAQYINSNITSKQIINSSIGYGYTSASINQGLMNQGGFGASGNFRSSNNSFGVSLSNGPATFGKRGPATKPFTGSTSRSTISPYLGLFNNGLLGDEISNYNTIVRPQLRQQRINQRFQQQAQQLNQQFQQAVARPAYNPQGSEQTMATGHRTLFNYTGHFYPTRQ